MREHRELRRLTSRRFKIGTALTLLIDFLSGKICIRGFWNFLSHRRFEWILGERFCDQISPDGQVLERANQSSDLV